MTNKEKSEIQKSIVDSLPSNSYGRLLLAPRVGKTRLVILYIKREKPKKILWVTPTTKLAEEDIPREFVIWKAKRYLDVLRTTTWKSLHKVKGEYDLIVLDEDQHISEMNSLPLRDGSLSGKSILSMTGTPTKDEDKIYTYKNMGLKTLYEISINQAVDIGLVSDYKINVLTSDIIPEFKVYAGGKNKFLVTEKSNYAKQTELIKSSGYNIFRILSRVRAIQNSPTKLCMIKSVLDHLPGRKVIYAPSIKISKELCQFTYNGNTNTKHLDMFIKEEINCISMVNKGGTGYTFKNVDHFLIMQCDKNTNGLTSQKITRALLSQEGYKATIWLFCLTDTVDKHWVDSVLESFDLSKVEFLPFSYSM